MFRNVTLFRFPVDAIAGFLLNNALEGCLHDCALKPVGALELSSCGFVSPFGRDSDVMSHQVGDHTWLSVGREDKMLPGAVINDLLAKKLAEIEQREGRKPGGRARKQIKEDLVHELLPRAFVKPGRTDVVLDIKNGWCIVDTSSRKTAENAVSEIRHALGSFPALPVNAEVAPRSVLTGWIAGEPLPEGLQVGDECELRDASDKGAIVKCQRQEMQGDEIAKHLEAGKQVTRLALTLDDHVSFVLGEDLVIRKLKLLDGAVEALESTERDDVRAELDARFALFAGEMNRLLAVLGPAFKVSAPDGEAPRPDVAAIARDPGVRAAAQRFKDLAEREGVTISVSGPGLPETVIAAPGGFGDESDPVYADAVKYVRESGKTTISGVQRVFKLGYNRAARLIETMEANGVVTAPSHTGERKVCAITAMDA